MNPEHAEIQKKRLPPTKNKGVRMSVVCFFFQILKAFEAKQHPTTRFRGLWERRAPAAERLLHEPSDWSKDLLGGEEVLGKSFF